ncbi:OmpA family protein [Marinobacter bohaiensis]|uniref:OmpA family protein n=1 Tax=Marinobacter bohaiensis TaxID=2201898 RepID=UPI000DAB7740|nr:OmpA family protein [Marinobacter bohaiensis]
MNHPLPVVLLAGLLLAGCQSAHVEEGYSRTQLLDIRDLDGDGVVNVRDLCGDTPTTSEVGVDGCAEWTLESRHRDFVFRFDFDRQTLREDQIPVLTEVLQMLRAHPQARIVLVGDTSSEGTDDYNHRLGQRRANTIVNALVGRGMDRSRVVDMVYDDPALTNIMQQRQRRTIVRVFYPQLESIPKWTIYTTENQRQEASQ